MQDMISLPQENLSPVQHLADRVERLKNIMVNLYALRGAALECSLMPVCRSPPGESDDWRRTCSERRRGQRASCSRMVISITSDPYGSSPPFGMFPSTLTLWSFRSVSYGTLALSASRSESWGRPLQLGLSAVLRGPMIYPSGSDPFQRMARCPDCHSGGGFTRPATPLVTSRCFARRIAC
jgi:hypothetical protein